MDLVRICHPHPDVADAMVAPSAVDVWRQSGWLTEAEYASLQEANTEAEKQGAEADKAADEPPGEPKPKTMRRRNSEEKD